MLLIDSIEFPSKNLTCYESVLMTLLKYGGVGDDAAFLGTQAYFVFSPRPLAISPKFNSVNDEWLRLYGLQIEQVAIDNVAALSQAIDERLGAGLPVCLPVDIFALPHTMHYQKLHQHHYVNIFAVEDGRYYMVCPYYRFQGWVEAALIYDGFFSPVVEAKGAVLITIPEPIRPSLNDETVATLVEENCRYGLNIDTPPTFTTAEPHYLGLAGLQTFAQHFQQMADEPDGLVTYKSDYINLSRHLAAVGYSRYWFQQIVQEYGADLLSPAMQERCSERFTAVVQTWKSLGLQLGMGIHGQRIDIIQRVAAGIEKMYDEEMRLFNTLLGALPHYEQGIV